MERKYCRSSIGKIIITNEGYKCECIDGGSRNHYLLVKIDNYETEVQSSAFRNGSVKNPYNPSVFGKGYVGVGHYNSKDHCKLYSTWQGMLERAYYSKYHEKKPTYKDVTVCKEWHNLQVFGKWFETNYIEGFELDKDLLGVGCKIYQPDSCLFIPGRLNSFLANSNSNNTSGFTGVHLRKDCAKWVAYINIDGKKKHLGYFNTAEEASKMYGQARAVQADQLRKLYKDILPGAALNNIK